MYIEVQIFKILEAVLQLRELGENEIVVDSCGDTEGLYRHQYFREKKDYLCATTFAEHI